MECSRTLTKSRGASEQILESKKVELELVFSVSIFCSLALLDFAKVKRPSIVPGLCIFTNHSFGSRLLPGSPGSPWKIKIFWDLRSAYGKCYHFFGHPRVLAPRCSLGPLPANGTGISNFKEKSQFWLYVKGPAFCLWEMLPLFRPP